MSIQPATPSDYENGVVPIEYSGWTFAQQYKRYPQLQGDSVADVVVVGAGLAGASLALHLAERGINVVVLEAKQPGNGASGRNAGHVQTILDSFEPLKTWPNGGKDFLDFFIEHRDIVFDLCAKHRIDGDAEKSGMIEAAFKKHASMDKKVELWKSFGYDVDIVTTERLGTLLGTTKYHYGIHWREGGRVNPYCFTNGMIATAEQLGATVFGDSAVIACNKQGKHWRVRTASGNVLAKRVIICTNGHTGNAFFPELARTQYPLVACGLATQSLSKQALDIINPSRAAFTQFPTGLYPIVVDGQNRLITATIPHAGGAQDSQTYFNYLLRFLHRTYPQLDTDEIRLGSYWTGITASASAVYHEDFPKLYRVDDGVLALMNLGTWGNVMGPLLGKNVADAIASDCEQNLVIPLEKPNAVKYPRLFELKIRRLAIPAARIVDRFNLA